MYRLLNFIQDFYEKEKFQIINFIPVFFGLGICSYFYLDNEPSVIFSFVCFIISLIFSLLTQNKISYVIFLFFSGFLLSQLRTISINIPLLEKEPEKPTAFFATIESCNHTENGLNFIVKNINSPFLLNKLFLTWKGEKAINTGENYMPGDRLSIFAQLSPLRNQAFPEQYDFKKQQYFNGISARGFIFSTPKKVQNYLAVDSVELKIEKFRHKINEKIDSILDKDIASIAKAIITGTKAGISKKLRENFTLSGTAHILAISGLHIGIIGIFIFWISRLLLNLFLQISMFMNVKKIAALISLIGVILYYFISGCSVSALRALIMHSLVIIGIIINRKALTMRSVAIAAMIILILSPEVIMFPSFQLSFSAVIAIVSFYEKHWNFSSYLGMIFNIIATTLVASLATSIFSIFIFNQLTLNSIFANIFAIPLMTFFIMPMSVISLIFLIFDIIFPLKILAYGIKGLINLIEYSSQLPGSLFIMPTPSDFTMCIFIFSGLILSLLHYNVRLLGILGIFIGCVFYYFEERPKIIISPYAKAYGIKVSDELVCCNHCGYFRGIMDTWTKTVGCEKRKNFNSKECRKFVKKSENGKYIIKLNKNTIELSEYPERENKNIIYLDKSKDFTREIYLPSFKEISNKYKKRPWNYYK